MDVPVQRSNLHTGVGGRRITLIAMARAVLHVQLPSHSILLDIIVDVTHGFPGCIILLRVLECTRRLLVDRQGTITGPDSLLGNHTPADTSRDGDRI